MTPLLMVIVFRFLDRASRTMLALRLDSTLHVVTLSGVILLVMHVRAIVCATLELV